MPSRTAELLLNTLANVGHVVTVEKPWGVERFVDCDDFLVKVIEVSANHRTSLQYHRTKQEVVTVLSGEGFFRVEDAVIKAGDPPAFVAPLRVHRAVGPVLLLEVTTPENDDVVRVADDYGRKEGV